MKTSEIVSDSFLLSILEASVAVREQCTQLLDCMADEPHDPDLPAQRKQLDAQLSHLRTLSRAAAVNARKAKASTAEARASVDTLHLQLRNLDYEQRHLRSEIWACESYDHRYQQLPLIPGEAFLALKPELEGADEHALMVARIEHEREEREALEAERQGLLKQKQKLIADNIKRKDELAKLDDNLEKFIDAARPIQEIFEKA